MDIYGIRFGLPCYSVTRKTGETLVRRKVLLVAYSARILYVIASSIRCEYFGPRIFLIRIFATGDPTRPLSLGPSLLSAPSPGFRPRGRLPRRRLLPSRLRSRMERHVPALNALCRQPTAAITSASSCAVLTPRRWTFAFAVGWTAVAPPTSPTAMGSSIVPTRSPFASFSHAVRDR